MPPETVEIKNKRRSQRVIPGVAVVVSTDSYDAKVISEATVMQVVNAHGRRLSLRMKVESEQRFFWKI
jgi:hypothetical protein